MTMPRLGMIVYDGHSEQVLRNERESEQIGGDTPLRSKVQGAGLGTNAFSPLTQKQGGPKLI